MNFFPKLENDGELRKHPGDIAELGDTTKTKYVATSTGYYSLEPLLFLRSIPYMESYSSRQFYT